MPKWDRMDSIVWESSEVMKELERIYKKSDLNKQLRDLVQNAGPAANALTQLSDKLDKAQKIMNPGNNAEDSEEIASEPKKPKKPKNKISKKQHKKAKKKLLNELNNLASDASQDLDHKLAYKIERAIDAILYED